MIAGGYTSDSTIFNKKLRLIDGEQETVPVLAFYPILNVASVRVFQIYIWPNEMPIGISGQVTSVTSPRDASGSHPLVGALLEHKQGAKLQQSLATSIKYALLLDSETFETVAEYELYNEVDSLSEGGQINYRETDDILFICLRHTQTADTA